MSDNSADNIHLAVNHTSTYPVSECTYLGEAVTLESALLADKNSTINARMDYILAHSDRRTLKLHMLHFMEKHAANKYAMHSLLHTAELPWSKIHGKMICRLIEYNKIHPDIPIFKLRHIPFPELYMHRLMRECITSAPAMRIKKFTDDELNKLFMRISSAQPDPDWFRMNSDTIVQQLGLNTTVDIILRSVIMRVQDYADLLKSDSPNKDAVIRQHTGGVTSLFDILANLYGGKITDETAFQFFTSGRLYTGILPVHINPPRWMDTLVDILPVPVTLRALNAITDNASQELQKVIGEKYTGWDAQHVERLTQSESLKTGLAILDGMRNNTGIISKQEYIKELKHVSTLGSTRISAAGFDDCGSDATQSSCTIVPSPPPPPLPDSHDNDSASSSCAKNGLALRVVQGLQLSAEDGNLKRYMSLSDVDVPLVATPDPDRVFEQLSALFPWAERANAIVCRQLSISRIGMGYVHINPLLLAGPPGVGKTRYSKELARILGVPMVYYGAAGSSDAMLLKGNARGWSTARPSLAMETVYRFKIANPIILIDEIDKAGSGNHNGRVEDYLHSVLEPDSARSVLDECFMIPTDLSAVTWLLTANHKEKLSGSLLSRLTVVNVPAPPKKYHETVVRGVLNSVLDEHGVSVHQLPDISDDMWAAFMKAAYRPRTVRKMVEAWVGEVGRTISMQ